MNLTASLIIRNEASRYLEPCIGHLLEFVDYVRILDDGSTDGWLESMRGAWGKDGRRVAAKINDRRPGDAFTDHAQARNRLLEWTLNDHPTYVLAIDADELVSDGAAVRAACEQGGDVLSLEIAEVWEACPELLCVREDGGWRSHQIGCVWRADRFRGGVLTDRGHATGRVPDAVHRVSSRPTGAALLHFGWTNVPERIERFARYDVGDGGRFHAAAHIQSIMWAPERVKLEGREWPESWSAGLRSKVMERANRP